MPTFATAAEAERAFYDAFERADIELMMAVWDDGDDCACIHPMGARLEGRARVEASWRALFSGGPTLRFTPRGLAAHAHGPLAVHCLVEEIRHGPGFKRHARVLATNVYRLTANGWRMIVHHGSPDAPGSTPAASGPLH